MQHLYIFVPLNQFSAKFMALLAVSCLGGIERSYGTTDDGYGRTCLIIDVNNSEEDAVARILSNIADEAGEYEMFIRTSTEDIEWIHARHF